MLRNLLSNVIIWLYGMYRRITDKPDFKIESKELEYCVDHEIEYTIDEETIVVFIDDADIEPSINKFPLALMSPDIVTPAPSIDVLDIILLAVKAPLDVILPSTCNVSNGLEVPTPK